MTAIKEKLPVVNTFASAKVRYEEFDGNVQLSVIHRDDSQVDFMSWLVKATEFYQNRLKFDHDYGYVRCFVIDYRFGNESLSVIVTREKVEDYTGHTYGM